MSYNIEAYAERLMREPRAFRVTINGIAGCSDGAGIVIADRSVRPRAKFTELTEDDMRLGKRPATHSFALADLRAHWAEMLAACKACGGTSRFPCPDCEGRGYGDWCPGCECSPPCGCDRGQINCDHMPNWPSGAFPSVRFGAASFFRRALDNVLDFADDERIDVALPVDTEGTGSALTLYGHEWFAVVMPCRCEKSIAAAWTMPLTEVSL